MKKIKNETHIEGYLYEHKLDLKTSGPASKNPGVEFINGTIGIATDEDMLNVVQVHFTYVTETTAKGKQNATFNVLKNIIDGKTGTVVEHGKEAAGLLRIDSAIGLNEWYDKDGNLISQKRNEGGFVHVANLSEISDNEAQRATFNTDMVITGCTRQEANEERNIPEKVIVRGAIFDFRGSLLPVEYSAVNEGAMNYFEGLEASNKNPVFTRVWGKQVSQTITRTITEESAFGAPSVKTVKSSFKDFEITGAIPEPYAWDSEDTITAAEMKEAMANREVALAEIKKRQDEYQESKKNAIKSTNSTSMPTPKADDYNF
ncbi:MAG: hypothetical protein NC218_11430 [Acetobacter sp.]|nr:hypothetical protein [Acetobacter sp.]